MRIQVNGKERDWSGGTVRSLLELYSIDGERGGYGVAINGRICPFSKWDEQKVEAGDHVDIVQAVYGG